MTDNHDLEVALLGRVAFLRETIDAMIVLFSNVDEPASGQALVALQGALRDAARAIDEGRVPEVSEVPVVPSEATVGLPEDPFELTETLHAAQDEHLAALVQLLQVSVALVRDESSGRVEERVAWLAGVLNDALDALHAP